MNKKPFLKWIGGKTQIIDKIMAKIPKEINDYHEPFVGGGSVLFSVLSDDTITINGNIYAYDSNQNLISVYRHIQNDYKTLYSHLILLWQEYDSLKGTTKIRQPKTIDEARTSKESYYYWNRKQFNSMENSYLKSALFIFLNKTCFRGMYREGPNGFNVPYGHYKKTPTLLKEDKWREIHFLLKNVIFQCMDFQNSICDNIKPGDFLYLDPPYFPKNKTSFVQYTKDGFGMHNHKLLFEKIKGLEEKKILFLLSNSKVQLVLEEFKNFHINEIECRRAIHSKNPASKAMEVLIQNYT